MKKIFITLCCLVALLVCFTVPCIAAEAEETPEISTGATTDVVGEISASEEHNTLFTRLWEFANKYNEEIFIVAGDGILGIIVFCLIRKNSKSTKTIEKKAKKMLEELGTSVSNQNKVVDVVNKLIDSYNNMAAKYEALTNVCEKYGSTEEERNKVIGALATEAATVLDILSTVYAHNKNLPQGVKDLVNIKYAGCLKALDNECGLASIVDAVHSALAANNTEVTEAKGNAEG